MPFYAKVGIIDDRWLTIGSANLNEHSLFNDTEVNILTLDAELARKTRLQLWSEHLQRPVGELGGDPVTVIYAVWKPVAERPSGIIHQSVSQPGHVLTIVGFVGIGVAVVFYAGSTLVVVATALRLLAYRSDKRRCSNHQGGHLMNNTPTATLVCPKCQGAMRSYERNGVTIDQCQECRGVFLDRGELERLIAAEERSYDTRAVDRSRYRDEPPSYQRSFDQDQGDSKHGSKQRGKRRGGFFSDLFD
jgi:Zn-finger nucleic acid-binding protein